MLDWSSVAVAVGVLVALLAISYGVLRALGPVLRARTPGRLRHHLASLLQGADAGAPDPRETQRRAIEINDDIVQGLTVASLALQLGHTPRAQAAVDRALASSRSIISDLLGEHGSATRLGPGDLVRQEAALRHPAQPVDAG